MAMTIEQLTNQAVDLTPEEKLRLADALVEQVMAPTLEWEAAWLHEVRERRAEYLAGTHQASPMEEVFARLRQR